MSRLNLLFVVADQLRADVAYHEAYPFVQTPNLDRLRRRGTTFTNTFCQYPVCGPSRASFITGRYPQQVGVLDNRSLLPPEERTWGHHLEANGFETVAFGKTHGMNPGFTRYPEPDFLMSLGTTEWGWFSGQSMTTASREEPRRPLVGVLEGGEAAHYDVQVTSRAVRFLSQRDANRPFAMFVGLHTPHPPLFLPAAYHHLYSPDETELFEVSEDPATKPSIQQAVREPWLGSSEDVRRELVAAYLAQVTLMDACLGRLLDGLEHHGLLGDTLIIFTADHGEQLGEHNMLGKFNSFYEGSLRVPLVLSLSSKIQPERNSSALVELLDIVPTLFDLLGVPQPDSLGGKTLLPLLEHSERSHRSYVHAVLLDKSASKVGHSSHFTNAVRGQMVRSERLKLAVYTDGAGELYDLVDDPAERVNRYADRALFDEKTELLEALLRHAGSTFRTPPLWGHNNFPG